VSPGDVVQIIVPTLSALTGLVSAVAALIASRAQLQKLASEATRTGVSASPGAMPLALAEELKRSRAAHPRG
jgi:hypothetical protein